MTILIVKTGAAIEPVKSEYGDFEDWFQAGLQQPCQVVDVTLDQPLPESGYSAVVITGSPAMVTERLAWSERTAAWLRRQPEQLPMLGVCYGHQLLAHAFGGVVADNPQGRQIGTVTISFDPAINDPLVGGLPGQLQVQSSHLQSVIKPPPGATVLANSPRDPNHVIRFRPNVWGVQFHPEWHAGITRGYLEARRDLIEQEGQDVDALLATTQGDGNPELLATFAKLATPASL